MERHPKMAADPRAHLHEHSVEVQLPFLARRRPDLQVLPIVYERSSRSTEFQSWPSASSF
ncbi:MAG: AmmeMemoRadiSam system protein B [bacterium]